MKATQIFSLVILVFLLLPMNSCVKDKFEDEIAPEIETEEEEEETPVGDISLTELKIPEGFEFSTSEVVSIFITDTSTDVKYDVYAYSDQVLAGDEVAIVNDEGQPDTAIEYQSDVLNHILFSGRPTDGVLEHTLTVPSYYNQLYIRRKEGTKYSSEIITIENGMASYTHSTVSAGKFAAYKNIVEDYLYCVNGAGELFQVNPLDGALTYISDMPNGSWTAAIDQENLFLYSIGKSSPYPLNRYDISNDTWTVMGNVGRGGPRLDYNPDDGLLYFSTGDKLYTIDPNNANTISTWDIEGLHNKNGGDLAIAADGTFFLCSFSGLYRLDLDNNNVYQSTRISAENLPFAPTSMTFDSNNELWLANNGTSSNLIVMDTETGGWQYNYGPDSGTAINFNRTINDLTTFRIIDEETIDPDTDGDGITDSNDEFPNDADKAFEQFTPSKYGWGTIAFEDLWPFLGDYDFNDTAVNYRFVAILNSENKAVELEINYEITSDGAGLVNGFGIELENLVPSQISSVTGTTLNRDYITLAGNGLEENQDNAVVILFDDNEGLVNIPSKVTVTFTTPITTAELGIAPFNPFLIVGQNREHEIHLPNRGRTSLGVNVNPSDGVNVDSDGNYKTATGLPWAIDIIHNFKVPKERVPVNQAYNFFNQWAVSGGTVFSDWYKDTPGYRNEAQLKEQD